VNRQAHTLSTADFTPAVLKIYCRKVKLVVGEVHVEQMLWVFGQRGISSFYLLVLL